MFMMKKYIRPEWKQYEINTHTENSIYIAHVFCFCFINTWNKTQKYRGPIHPSIYPSTSVASMVGGRVVVISLFFPSTASQQLLQGCVCVLLSKLQARPSAELVRFLKRWKKKKKKKKEIEKLVETKNEENSGEKEKKTIKKERKKKKKETMSQADGKTGYKKPHLFPFFTRLLSLLCTR